MIWGYRLRRTMSSDELLVVVGEYEGTLMELSVSADEDPWEAALAMVQSMLEERRRFPSSIILSDT